MDSFPNEILELIFEYVRDDSSYASMCRVCKTWNEIAEHVWKNYCKSRGFLEDEKFWNRVERDWKWICKSKVTRLLANESGVGWLKTSGMCFIGDIENNMLNGVGYSRNDRGSTWRGQWKDNKLDGFGVYTNCDGDTFVGFWSEGKQNGYGVYKWKKQNLKGQCYRGYWMDGLKDGKGRFTYPGGAWYEGDFKDDLFHGKGKYMFRNGNTYEGNWKNGCRMGYGVYKYKKHQIVYEGEHRGTFYGRGTLTWKNGDRYEGKWKNNSRIGNGILYCSNGQVYQQHWNPYSLIRVTNLNEPERFPPDNVYGTSVPC